MTQGPKAKIMHYACQIRKKGKSAHFFRYLRKNYVKSVTDELRMKNSTSAAVWMMGNGNIKTNKKVKTHFILPELYPERIIEHTFHLLPTMTGYDMIIGTDLMSELGR